MPLTKLAHRRTGGVIMSSARSGPDNVKHSDRFYSMEDTNKNRTNLCWRYGAVNTSIICTPLARDGR